MRSLRAAVLRVLALFSPSRRERDLADEIESHLALDIADRVARGVDPIEARRQAILRLGGIEPVKEAYRDRRALPLVETSLQDLRYAGRLMRRNPGFTILAVLTLAIGIGANTAIFGLVDPVLLRTLPVDRPDRLVLLERLTARGQRQNQSHPMFERLRESGSPVFVDTFAALDGFYRLPVAANVSAEEAAQGEEARVQLVSGGYFDVLGVRPAAGRLLAMSDDGRGSEGAAVLSHDYWTRRFARSPAAVGARLTIKDQPVTIVGVAGQGFFGDAVGSAPEIWLTLAMQPRLDRGVSRLDDPSVGWLRVYARLRPDVTAEQASAVVNASLSSVKAEGTSLAKSASNIASTGVADASHGMPRFREQFTIPLRILSAVAGIVLLIVCANVASLLLARAASRQGEIAIRLALGAGRGRLVRQVLTESLCLAIAGGAVGLLIAWWGSGALLTLLSEDGRPIPIDVTPNARLLAFTAAVSIGVVLAFGLAPALSMARSRRPLAGMLQAVRVRRPLSPMLVVSQVALSFVLLTGAALFVQTLQNLRARDVGFAPDALIQLRIRPEVSGYTPEQFADLSRRVVGRLASVPGVRSASAAHSGITTGTSRTCCLAVEGYSHDHGENREIHTLGVAPGYFGATGVALLRGRDFRPYEAATDPRDTPTIAIVNEEFVRRYVGSSDPIGRRVGWGNPPKVTYGIEIVGIVRNAVFQDLRQGPLPLIYFPSARGTMFLVRAEGDPLALIPTIRRELQAFDPNLEVSGISPVAADLERTLVRERLLARLSTAFGMTAALLAAVGLYGLMVYTVAVRTHEIGIRMALGAARGLVLRAELWSALKLAAVGVALGVPAVLAAGRLIRAQVFGVSATDPATLAVVGGVLIGLAAGAAYLPARRASAIDPMRALRSE